MNRIFVSETPAHTNKKVKVAGWVGVRRDHGKLIFIDLRDKTGLLQVVFGSDFNELLLTTDLRFYVNNPIFDNTVLALCLAAAWAIGPDFRERYYLGGTEGVSMPSIGVRRSYPLRGWGGDDVLQGTGFVAAYAEYLTHYLGSIHKFMPRLAHLPSPGTRKPTPDPDRQQRFQRCHETLLE